MSTYLQLCQIVRQEVGGAGTGPSAVTGQVGELARIVTWVARGDEDVQRKCNDWKFMVGSFTVNTVADDGSYTATDCGITKLRDWDRSSFKIYLQSAGVSDENPLQYIDYDTWYRTYNTGAQTSSRPCFFTIAPDMSIKLGPKPSAVYVVSGEYKKSVTTMTANTDTPAYPEEFHMLAAYRAMRSYGIYTGAPEVVDNATRLYRELMAEMARTQMPEICMADPLV